MKYRKKTTKCPDTTHRVPMYSNMPIDGQSDMQ